MPSKPMCRRNKQRTILKDALIGVTGAAPCVGVILVPSDHSLPTYAIHFAPGDDPLATFHDLFAARNTPLGHLPRINLTGYRAVLCGAENLPAYEADENWLLSELWRAMGRYGVSTVQYVPGPNAHVDREGNVYWTTPDMVDTTNY